MNTEVVDFRPQLGPQEAFLSTPADIAFYGGAAGGGKTFGLLLDPIRNFDVPGFGGVIFRRTKEQVRNEGGLWDESMGIYVHAEGEPLEHRLEWRFPHRVSMSFANLEYDKDVLNYQGAQIAWMGFDEVTHFSENQFFYMLSRSRSTCGVRPVVRATCNPDPDSWVRRFIDWWIGEDGFAIPERSGVVRWFIRINDSIHWGDSRDDLLPLCPKYTRPDGTQGLVEPKSVTFIAAKLEDNRVLMEKNPEYLGNLLSLSRVDRMRLHEGNWNVRASAGTLFQREWFPIVDIVPGGWISSIRFWDRAATKPHEGNKDPDWTRGLKMYKYADGRYCVVDLKSMRDTPLQVETLVLNTAAHDGQAVRVMSQQDPGSAGVAEADNFIRMLTGYDVHVMTTNKDKLTRAKPVSAQAEAHNIMVLRGAWNESFFSELENFPEGAHDDIVDVLSGAFNEMGGGLSTVDAFWQRGNFLS